MTVDDTRNTDTVLLLSLACGATTEAAAHKAGVSRSTVHRRLNDPFFRRELKKLRSEMLERASAMLTASAMEAIKTLLELQKSSTPAAVRLGAARATLEVEAVCPTDSEVLGGGWVQILAADRPLEPRVWAFEQFATGGNGWRVKVFNDSDHFLVIEVTATCLRVTP